MVECECIKQGFNRHTIIVLIDTWWNVNAVAKNLDFIRHFVLIDTWWNVNFILAVLNFVVPIVLIDTWWNVNVSKPARYYTFDMF